MSKAGHDIYTQYIESDEPDAADQSVRSETVAHAADCLKDLIREGMEKEAIEIVAEAIAGGHMQGFLEGFAYAPKFWAECTGQAHEPDQDPRPHVRVQEGPQRRAANQATKPPAKRPRTQHGHTGGHEAPTKSQRTGRQTARGPSKGRQEGKAGPKTPPEPPEWPQNDRKETGKQTPEQGQKEGKARQGRAKTWPRTEGGHPSHNVQGTSG